MRKIRIVIIGAGREGSSLYHCFRMKPNVEIVGIADVTKQGLGLDEVQKVGVIVSQNLKDVVTLPNIDVIVETTKDPVIRREIYELKSEDTQMIEANGLDLLMTLGNKKEKAEAELLSVLNSIQDAVEIANNDGIITYVNPTFEKITGIPREKRIGANIFEVCPESPLAIALKTQQPVHAEKEYIINYGKELMFHASPIMVRDELHGAVAVFRPLTNVIKLMEELQKSTSIIESLYDKFSQLNGLAELNVSDVMPIDKMEQLLLRQALTKFGYSVEGKKKAAKALNISLATLYNKLKKYQIS
ncbi:Fis family transcriptional regulator [Thermincola ferriacetica]|uniref:Fis family transcriptional regulator n=1 Tax=Thermincola ferriacetica TaxID=281456 RepID=A0A0L6W6X2_9FIRM|nr:PAS domain-containing protein [Thermincola ferriacetica]KNZ70849.1 Fis family transcriptional regulator [Thermincola ferriacetica]